MQFTSLLCLNLFLVKQIPQGCPPFLFTSKIMLFVTEKVDIDRIRQYNNIDNIAANALCWTAKEFMLCYGLAKFTLRLDWCNRNTPLFCDIYTHRHGCRFIVWKSGLASRDRNHSSNKQGCKAQRRRYVSNANLAAAQSIALYNFLQAVFRQLFDKARHSFLQRTA